MAEQEGKTIHSVAKAIRLLDLLTAAGQPASLTELYQKTGWPKSTIHGLLSTMREAGLIEQNANGRYWLGIRLFEYGCAVSNAWDISAIARPYMQELSDALGESVFLSVLDRAAVVTLAEVESRASLRVVSEIGARLPIHCTSQGKLFLAFGTQAEARRILTRGVLEAHTPRTLTSYEAFLPELAKIRTQGYAVEQAARAAQARGFTSALLNVGGNLRAIGTKPGGKPWTAGVENPWGDDPAYIQAVELADGDSLVISGDYQRYFEYEGVRYAHLIDLTTGYPARYVSSVAVLAHAETGGLADALSTGLFCLPEQTGRTLADRNGWAALWMHTDKSTAQSADWPQ